MWWHNTSTMQKSRILLHLTFSEPYFQASSVKYLMTVCRLTHAFSQTLINFLLIQNYLWNKGFSGFPGKFFKARFIPYWSIAVNVTKILRACHGTFSKPPNDLCKTAFYHIRNISRIRPCLSIDSTKTLVHVLVMSRLDHCNSFLYGLLSYLETTICYERSGKSDHLQAKAWSCHITTYWATLASRPSAYYFLRFYCTPSRHSMVRLQRTWLSSSELMFLSELSGLLTSFNWSNQHTSSNWLAWGLSQCARLTHGTRFHLRLKAAHLSLYLKLSWRPIFFHKHIFRL